MTEEMEWRDQAFGTTHLAFILGKEMNEKPDEQQGDR